MKNALPLLTAAVLSLWASSALAGDDFFVSPTGGLVGGGYFVGKNSLIYTGSNVIGLIPENTIVKLRQTFERAGLRSE